MRTTKPRAYFAHSMQTYHTPEEASILKVLREKYRVICPNHDIGDLKPFSRYLNIVAWADVVIVWEFESFITMGVYAEIVKALQLEIPVLVVRKTRAGFVFGKVDRVECRSDNENRNHYGKLIILQMQCSDSSL